MNTKQRYPLFAEDRILASMQEQFPYINEEPHLVFKDARGKIRAGCYFGDHPSPKFDLGIIPEEIASKGADAARAHAQEKMEQLIATERQRRIDRDDRVESLHREYTVERNGVIIRGFIEKAECEGPRADFMLLTMTEPFQLKEKMHVRPQCFADGMHGTRSFDADGNLLEQEIRRQKENLISMYEREVRRQNRPPAHPLFKALALLRSDDEDDSDE